MKDLNRFARFEDEDGVIQMEFDIVYRDADGNELKPPHVTVVAFRRDNEIVNLPGEKQAEMIDELLEGLGAQITA
jgi:hypothetical protein